MANRNCKIARLSEGRTVHISQVRGQHLQHPFEQLEHQLVANRVCQFLHGVVGVGSEVHHKLFAWSVQCKSYSEAWARLLTADED